MERIKAFWLFTSRSRIHLNHGWRIALFIVAYLVVIGAEAGTGPASSRPSVSLDNIEELGGDFTLQSADGPVALHDMRGDVVLLYFGYTHCPDACPITLTQWRAAFKSLPAHTQERVRGIFVSVDPERDTLELLKTYARHFHPNIIGVTGTQSELQKISAEYRASYEKADIASSSEYAVNHSGYVYVIDPTGKVRDLLTFQSSADEIAASIRAAMRVGY